MRHHQWYVVLVAICFIPYWPLLLYWARDPEKNYSKLVRARRQIARLSSRLAGFRYQVREEVKIDWSAGPYVLCANHTSNLDITAMTLVCGADFSFVGKEELLHNPVTGLYFRTIDIPVKRESKMSAFRAFKRAGECLDKGRSVVIFPEGKIGPDYPPQLCPFKIGPFRMAAEKNIPIIPVVIQNAWQLHWDNGALHGSKRGTIRIDVLSPIFPAGADTEAGGAERGSAESMGQVAETLKDQVYTLLNKRWKRL